MMEPLSCSYLTGNSGRDSERWIVFLKLLRFFTSFSDCFFIDEVLYIAINSVYAFLIILRCASNVHSFNSTNIIECLLYPRHQIGKHKWIQSP